MLLTLFGLITIANAQVIQAPAPALKELTPSAPVDGTVYIFGAKEETFTQTGSAHVVSKEELAEFEYEDAGKILKKVPGVNIQEEDGYGLRPNIGMRGTHPHRSKKVTLMEDGILSGPAPYSAPAAYYFPLAIRAQSVEVFKGPSSIKYGPNSIGGAVNLVSSSIPSTTMGELNLSAGSLKRIGAKTGSSSDGSGWLLEYNNLSSDGFKTLPNGGETGFKKNDLLVKGSLFKGSKSAKKQNLVLKLGYSDEDSHETYLGLANSDFSSDPNQRYSASQNDRMLNDHQLIQLHYDLKVNSDLDLNTKVYHHQFRRNWSKFNGLNNNTSVSEILDDPTSGINQYYYSIIKGEQDTSASNGSDLIVIGDNDRKYFSQGIQTEVTYYADDALGFEHDINIGMRFHKDQVKRHHSENLFNMTSGYLSKATDTYKTTTLNKDDSQALMTFVNDQIQINDLKVDIGARVENVTVKREDKLIGQSHTRKDTYFVPGGGVFYEVNRDFGLLAGINKGVTIVGPGQSDLVAPGESVNYETGVRYNGVIYAETIAFYSDYKNIKGSCSFSSGCDDSKLTEEYNGGKAKIRGIEALISKDIRYKKWTFPVSLNYTLTRAEFDSTTISNNEEWGIGQINPGDPLPYIPLQRYSLSTGFRVENLSTSMIFNWQSKMYDQAVQVGRKEIPAYGVIDLAMKYKISDARLFLKVENIFDNTYLVSYRPYGARPGKPRLVTGGLQYRF
ncbi:TonB-dependent receptor plug domain-containing protein [Halobacteriovorax sp. HLS]|uniref:TonB-dependent receptor family protein n=1 Tax=Halobacteriovorax sp. HLS TaxID=2234000 RepID=UPI000FDAE2F1|nr:TonB-dependent receptor plug domain-containing protein [Halobacteriovorax sp. HLS]